MKYILIFLISITSHLSLASYHESEGGSSGSGGGGYGSGSDAIAYVGVGVLAYFLLSDLRDHKSICERNTRAK